MTPNEGKPSAEALYRRLVGETQSKQKQGNLTILWEVLVEQRERQSSDYSIVSISKLTAAKNGLKESSIRNKAGAEYRNLILLFAEEASVGGKKRANGPEGSWQTVLLAGIDDGATRARVGVILSENRKLKTELDLLKNAIQRDYLVPEAIYTRPETVMATPTPVKSVVTSVVAEHADVLPSPTELLPQELRAMEHFLSPEHLDAQGWRVTEHGALKLKNGMSVAKPGFATALRKILARPAYLSR